MSHEVINCNFHQHLSNTLHKNEQFFKEKYAIVSPAKTNESENAQNIYKNLQEQPIIVL